jgi:dUTP pyrophosphatase
VSNGDVKHECIVKVKKRDDLVLTPVYVTPGSAGCDVYSAEDVVLKPGERYLVSTGLFLEVPPGFECQIRPRSGLALKHGITVFNSPGTLDSDYRGEVKILLVNFGNEPFTVTSELRIAQLVFARVEQAHFVVVNELSGTERGEGGWGSTGTK